MPKQPHFHRIERWVKLDRALRAAAQQISEEQGLVPAVAYQCAYKAALLDVAYDLWCALGTVGDKIEKVGK